MKILDNLAVRIVLFALIMVAIWNGVGYLSSTFIWHEVREFRPLWDIGAPVAIGIVWAFTWKPKEEQQKSEKPNSDKQ